MKKFLITLCLLLLIPSLTQAAIYQNNAYNFKVNLPDTWTKPTDTTSDFPILISEDIPIGIIDIYIEDIQKAFGNNTFPSLKEANNTQSENMIDILISDLKANYPDVKIMSSEKTTINNQAAIVIVHSYSYMAEKEAIVVTAYWTVFIENGLLYSLKLQTEDTSNSHMGDFFKMCESVEITS